MKYPLRLIAFPFVFGLILISAVRLIIKNSYLFLRYGGELMLYKEKHTPQSFALVLNKIEALLK